MYSLKHTIPNSKAYKSGLYQFTSKHLLLQHQISLFYDPSSQFTEPALFKPFASYEPKLKDLCIQLLRKHEKDDHNKTQSNIRNSVDEGFNQTKEMLENDLMAERGDVWRNIRTPPKDKS